MSFRDKVWSFLDVLLRVPPVFAMDAILNSGLGLTKTIGARDSPFSLASETEATETAEGESSVSEENLYVIELDSSSLGWFILYSQGFIIAFVVFLLNTKQLLALYLWMASVGVILWSYVWNEEYMKYAASLVDKHTNVVYEMISTNWRAALKFCGNYFVQMFLALIFCFSNSSSHSLLPKRAVGLSFICPTVISLLPLPTSILLCTPIASAGVSFLYIIFCLLSHSKDIYKTVVDGVLWSRTVLQHYGLYTLLENQWVRLHVPQVLRIFWLTRLTEQATFMIADIAYNNEGGGIISMTFESTFMIAKHLLVRGCETLVAILGMSSIVSSVSHYFGCMMQNFLLIEDPEDRSIGTVSAILFFILALQTGLTNMQPEKRFLRLYRNLCLLCTAIMHFIHNMVNPLLLSLSASRNTSLNRHGRALLVCAFLIAFPCWFLMHLWNKHTLSTWLLAVSAFSTEVIIKVIISLMVYTLFMIDAYRNTLWEKLDDYVYYIRATGNTIEFIFSIFLFFNGAWILLFESGGTIRATMMCVHAYFNIWRQAKAGWDVFIKRRTAISKIDSLPLATPEQLQNIDDVCAICYQELTSARVTKCNHYFHGVCIKKWLYVQDICPLCHTTLYTSDSDELNPPRNPNEDGGYEYAEHHEHPE